MGKSSLKHVLRNFLAHFESLEYERKTCDDHTYHREFHSLKELTEALKTDEYCTCDEGFKDVNRRKNRYKDILPYDNSRVIISEYPGVPGSDYINANYVKGSTGSSCAYIASQGPLPNTVVDFWRMIWECEVTLIIMACNERESGKYKCESYWPQGSDEEQQYGNITVKLVKWRQVCPDFLVRTLRIKQDGCERTVCQFHYTTWPDHGVPPHVQPILELVRLMRDVQATEARPILVHCSAGCGRTGTICSIDYVWALLRTGKLKEDFSLYHIIRDLRKQRIAMVQTYEQYVLCYRAVAALFEQQLKMIDAHTYENLDEDGQPLLIRSFIDDEYRNSSSASDSINDLESNCATASVNDMKKDFQEGPPEEMSAAECSTCDMDISVAPDHLDATGGNTPSDVKHEKLVGKATVIRRPSIAKLKAMFENIQIPDAVSRPPPQINRHPPLQRSQSTRERGSRSLTASRTSITSIDARQMAAEVANEVQCIYGTRNSPDSLEPQTEYLSPFQPRPLEVRERGERVQEQIRMLAANVAQNMPLNDGNRFTSPGQAGNRISKAPPKPPRTYQYFTMHPQHGRRELPEGRYIAATSTKLPQSARHDHGSELENLHHRHISTPNLAVTSNLSLPPPFANPASYNARVHAQQQFMEAQRIQLQGEAIYQALPMQRKMPPNPIYEQVNLRRDLSFPSLPTSDNQANHSKFIPTNKIAAVQRRTPAPFMPRPLSTFEGVYEVNKRPVLAEGQARPKGPLVTYVRPQPNPRLTETRGDSDSAKSKDGGFSSSDDKQMKQGKKSDAVGKSAASASTSSQDDQTHKTKQETSKKSSSFLQSFFGKARKEKPVKGKTTRAAVNTSQSSQQSGLVHPHQVNGIIRPPHSHRFSPPAQWTQV